MSDENPGILEQIPGRALAFIIFLLVSGPFMLIGAYKNAQIESCIEASGKCMDRYDHIGAEKKMEEGASHFSLLYDIYIIMPTFGGSTYYKENDYLGIRGVVRTTAIAQRMAEWNLDVEELIKNASHDLERPGAFSGKSVSMAENARKQIAALKKLLPVMKTCKEGRIEKAFEDFKAFILEKGNLEHAVVLMPVIRLAVELAEKSPSRDMAEKLLVLIRASSEESDNPFFKDMQRRASMIDLSGPRPTRTKVVAEPEKPAPPSRRVEPAKKPAKAVSMQEKFAAALAFARKKEFTEALPLFKECYGASPDNDKICYALALTQKNLGMNDEARRLCDEMLARNAGNTQAQKLLASIK
ncbi:MAG TPA: tetratricopeptide repeat protein [Candidatus Rifleibacterium sp.]|nr:tetratricopeptide repeat protein [Candidatus Rifleibacterium sp.]HPT44506.1 tetratricopeptide repeat protein [Candidatus Rifleibacterium sp.]